MKSRIEILLDHPALEGKNVMYARSKAEHMILHLSSGLIVKIDNVVLRSSSLNNLENALDNLTLYKTGDWFEYVGEKEYFKNAKFVLAQIGYDKVTLIHFDHCSANRMDNPIEVESPSNITLQEFYQTCEIAKEMKKIERPW